MNKMLAYNLTVALNDRTTANAICRREFDLVLPDINLLDRDGFELCRLIKLRHLDIIVIFLIANNQESDRIRNYEVGAVDYIIKHFVLGTL